MQLAENPFRADYERAVYSQQGMMHQSAPEGHEDPYVEERFKQYDSDREGESDRNDEGTDVVSFLSQAGKRYQQRLDLLRQQKIAAEMAQVTGKPNISPFAAEYFSNKMKLHQRLGKTEETVQERLHRLHQRKLEREQTKLSTYKAHQEKEEMAEVTLKPKITSQAKALSHRGSQAEITQKWLEEKRQKNARLHEYKLKQEMAEVQPVPMISPHSAEIVHAGVSQFFDNAAYSHNSIALVTDQSRREMAGSVSEYLLAREKQRQMRLKALAEARNRLEGSTFQPQISKRAQSLQMGPIERLYTNKKTPAEYAAMSGGEESESDANDAELSDDSDHSEYQEVYDKEGNVSVVKVKSRGATGRSKRRSKSRAQSRDGRSNFDKVFNPECTFKPYVSEASRLIVEERERRLAREKEEKEKIEGSQSPSPSKGLQDGKSVSPHNRTRATVRGTLPKKVNAIDDPAYKKVYPDHTFKPIISETSRQLALRRQQKYSEEKRQQEEEKEGNKEHRRGEGAEENKENDVSVSVVHRRQRTTSGDAPSPSSRLHEQSIGHSAASSVYSSTSNRKGRKMNQSTEQSVNRHLRMLTGGSTHNDSINEDGSVNDSPRAPSTLNGNNNRTLATNSAAPADDGFTGKPSLCPKSVQMARERTKRVRKELQREGSITFSATHASASSLSTTSSTGDQPISAHELMYQVGMKKKELKERKTAQELQARREAEEAMCTFTPQRSFRRKSTASTNPSVKQPYAPPSDDISEDFEAEYEKTSASQKYFAAPASFRQLRQEREEAEARAEQEQLERRRLVMTAEQSEAFARKNAQWLRRREQALSLMKRSEDDKDYEECTFHPQVHDQVPLPIGASANAPGVDNFLQRHREARERKEEEQRRRDGLGTSTVDKRPIGGYTKPEPFLLGKEREQKRLSTARAHRQQLDETYNSSRSYNRSGPDYSIYYDPQNLGSEEPPAVHASASRVTSPQQLTRKEWAEIRQQMLAPETAPNASSQTPRPQHRHEVQQGVSTNANTIHHYYNAQQRQPVPTTNTTTAAQTSAQGTTYDGPEFSQHPTAPTRNLLHQNYFQHNNNVGLQNNTTSTHKTGLFDKSPVDFVLNNHENILRQLQMKR